MRTIYIPTGQHLPLLDDHMVLVDDSGDKYAESGWTVIVKTGENDTRVELEREVKRVRRELSLAVR